MCWPSSYLTRVWVCPPLACTQCFGSQTPTPSTFSVTSCFATRRTARSLCVSLTRTRKRAGRCLPRPQPRMRRTTRRGWWPAPPCSWWSPGSLHLVKHTTFCTTCVAREFFIFWSWLTNIMLHVPLGLGTLPGTHQLLLWWCLFISFKIRQELKECLSSFVPSSGALDLDWRLKHSIYL